MFQNKLLCFKTNCYVPKQTAMFQNKLSCFKTNCHVLKQIVMFKNKLFVRLNLQVSKHLKK